MLRRHPTDPWGQRWVGVGGGFKLHTETQSAAQMMIQRYDNYERVSMQMDATRLRQRLTGKAGCSADKLGIFFPKKQQH